MLPISTSRIPPIDWLVDSWCTTPSRHEKGSFFLNILKDHMLPISTSPIPPIDWLVDSWCTTPSRHEKGHSYQGQIPSIHLHVKVWFTVQLNKTFLKANKTTAPATTKKVHNSNKKKGTHQQQQKRHTPATRKKAHTSNKKKGTHQQQEKRHTTATTKKAHTSNNKKGTQQQQQQKHHHNTFGYERFMWFWKCQDKSRTHGLTDSLLQLRYGGYNEADSTGKADTVIEGQNSW